MIDLKTYSLKKHQKKIMSELKIKKPNALTAYKNADTKGKKLLEELLGKENLVPDKVTDRIKTFEDACAELNIVPSEIDRNVLCEALPDDQNSLRAYAKLIIIVRALNEGWEPNWSDDNEYKYMPWFKHKSGFGLSYLVYDRWATLTVVGSRLCYKSRELAEYAGTQFADIYNDYLTIK